jgi:hypothetical protein
MQSSYNSHHWYKTKIKFTRQHCSTAMNQQSTRSFDGKWWHSRMPARSPNPEDANQVDLSIQKQHEIQSSEDSNKSYQKWSHSCNELTINQILWRQVVTLPNACEVAKPRGRESDWLNNSKHKVQSGPVQTATKHNKTTAWTVCLLFFYCGRLEWISRQPAGQTVGNEVPYRLMWRGDGGDVCGGSTRRDDSGRREFSWWCTWRA